MAFLRKAALAVLAAAVALIGLPGVSAAQSDRGPVLPKSGVVVGSASGEAALLRLLNRLRVRAGLRAVSASQSLGADARPSARVLAQPRNSHRLWHGSALEQHSGTCRSVRRRAENVAYTIHLDVGSRTRAGRVAARKMFRSYLRSPAHRANMLDPAVNHVGIAVMVRRHGSGVYATSVVKLVGASSCV